MQVRAVMVLKGGERLECEVHVDEICLEHVKNSNIWDKV